MNTRLLYIEQADEGVESTLYNFKSVADMATLIPWGEGGGYLYDDIKREGHEITTFSLYSDIRAEYLDAICAHFCGEFEYYFREGVDRAPKKRNKDIVEVLCYRVTSQEITFTLGALNIKEPDVHFRLGKELSYDELTYEMIQKEMSNPKINIYIKSEIEGVKSGFYPRKSVLKQLPNSLRN